MTAAREAELFGLDADMVVQELGWDEDTGPDLCDEIMDAIDIDMIEDAIEAMGVVVLWWREDDGDVVDDLMNAVKGLTPTGFIRLLTPRVGRPGYVSPSDLAEGTAITGLPLASSTNMSSEWQAHRAVRPKGTARR